MKYMAGLQFEEEPNYDKKLRGSTLHVRRGVGWS